jgi:hypothetical protein
MTNELLRLRSAASTMRGILIAPIITIAGEKTHALAVTLNDQAVTNVLDFVNQSGPVAPCFPE